MVTDDRQRFNRLPTHERWLRWAAAAWILSSASGCGDPGPGYGLVGGSSTEGDGTQPSSSGSGEATSGDTGTDTTATGAPALPPFELPEGCGDGQVVPGQYDCHFPVLLDDVQAALAATRGVDPADVGLSKPITWDMDGDGKDEIVVQLSLPLSPNRSGEGRFRAVLTWDGEGFVVGEPLRVDFNVNDWTTRFDVDADGQRDLLVFNNSVVAFHRGLGTTTISPEQGLFHAGWLDSTNLDGRGGPIDVDGDGSLEVLAVRQVFGPPPLQRPVTPKNLVLHSQTPTGWEEVGGRFAPVGCPFPARYAWADFNGDGHEDIAVLYHPTACDPYPLQYDPQWHAVAVFLVDPIAGRLVRAPNAPVGDVSHDEVILAEDFDGDGAVDMLVALGGDQNSPMHGAALLRGHGDGTFDEGVRVSLPGQVRWGLQGRADLDGDGDLDWVLSAGDTVIDDIFADPIDAVTATATSHVVGKDGKPLWGARVFGDFNGDGVGDWFGSWFDSAGDFHDVVMVSAP